MATAARSERRSGGRCRRRSDGDRDRCTVRSYGPRCRWRITICPSLSKRTGGITSVQARAFAYMGLACMKRSSRACRATSRRRNGIGDLPEAHGNYYWPLVASAAVAGSCAGCGGRDQRGRAEPTSMLEAQFERRPRSPWLSGPAFDRLRARRRAAVFETSKTMVSTRLPDQLPDQLRAGRPGRWVPLPPVAQPFWSAQMTASSAPGPVTRSAAGVLERRAPSSTTGPAKSTAMLEPDSRAAHHRPVLGRRAGDDHGPGHCCRLRARSWSRWAPI
jgi:hypothetical protein